MTDDAFQHLMWQYSYGPYRELRSILAMDYCIEGLKADAKAHGEEAWFLTLTFVGEQSPAMIKVWKRDFGLLLKRLKRKIKGVGGDTDLRAGSADGSVPRASGCESQGHAS